MLVFAGFAGRMYARNWREAWGTLKRVHAQTHTTHAHTTHAHTTHTQHTHTTHTHTHMYTHKHTHTQCVCVCVCVLCNCVLCLCVQQEGRCRSGARPKAPFCVRRFSQPPSLFKSLSLSPSPSLGVRGCECVCLSCVHHRVVKMSLLCPSPSCENELSPPSASQAFGMFSLGPPAKAIFRQQ